MQKLILKQQIKLPVNPKVRVALAGMLLVVIIRLIPYAFPISAQDIAIQDQAVAFFDRSGLPLGTILSRDQEHTAVVSLNQISPVFINAILAAEDQDFYHHGPIELKAIARAIYQTLETGKVQSGASTITMQLARMLGRNPRNLGAKLTEVWGAWRLAAGMNKTEILTAYVNRLPMGGNLYGVEAAARTYFGISAQELNLSQASLLAAIPNNPSNLNPYRHYSALKKRQRYVLNRLVKTGKITKEQGDRTYAEKITLQAKSVGIKTAPHFLFWLIKQLPKNHSAQIKTTLDRPLQEFIENQIKITLTTLKNQNVNQG
ncbi:MAG: transglycosylase domain-containing protein, partial [Microcystaceae cyanobacterium]